MIRVDPLTGLKVLAAGDGEPQPDAQPDLFSESAVVRTYERIEGAPLEELDRDRVAAALETWRIRMRALGDAAFIHMFYDRDGAQLAGFDFVPTAVARERERFGAYATRTMGGNLLGDLVAEEVRRRERIVAIDDEAVLFCPFAARVPYQLMIAPRRTRQRFQDDGPLGAFLLADALARLRRPVDLWVRTAPRGADNFCWRIDIMPRERPHDGLGLGTGLPTCGIAPEQVAAELR